MLLSFQISRDFSCCCVLAKIKEKKDEYGNLHFFLKKSIIKKFLGPHTFVKRNARETRQNLPFKFYILTNIFDAVFFDFFFFF